MEWQACVSRKVGCGEYCTLRLSTSTHCCPSNAVLGFCKIITFYTWCRLKTCKTQPNQTLFVTESQRWRISPAEVQVCHPDLHVWNEPQRQWHNRFVKKTTYAAFVATRRIFSPSLVLWHSHAWHLISAPTAMTEIQKAPKNNYLKWQKTK